MFTKKSLELEKTEKIEKKNIISVNTMQNMTEALRVIENSSNLNITEKNAISTIAELCLDTHQQLQFIDSLVTNNLYIEDENTQRLISNANVVSGYINNHCNKNILSNLSTHLVNDLRYSINVLLPLASGLYKPHGDNTIYFEVGHESIHFIEFIIHNLSNELAISNLLHAFSSYIPVISFAIKSIELWYEHGLIHKAQHMVNALKGYSDAQRTAIYNYVINSALLNMATRIDNGQPTGLIAEAYCHKFDCPLKQWYVLILAESMASLSLLHADNDIEKLACNWKNSLIKNLKINEVNMSYSYKEMQNLVYERNQLEVTYKVQKIFTANRENNINPSIPNILNYCHDLHKELYKRVFQPYDWRARGLTSSAVFLGYSTAHFKTLQDYHMRFGMALDIMNTELLPLKVVEGSTFDLQVRLINSCLLSNIHKMCIDLPWHSFAKNFYIENSLNVACVQEPLQLESNGKLKIILDKERVDFAYKQLEIVKQSYTKLSDECVTIFEKKCEAEDNANNYKARSEEALNLVYEYKNKYEEKIDLVNNIKCELEFKEIRLQKIEDMLQISSNNQTFFANKNSSDSNVSYLNNDYEKSNSSINTNKNYSNI